MSYGSDDKIWGITIGIMVVLCGAFFVLTQCKGNVVEVGGSANKHVKELLKKKGYTKIRITGFDSHFSGAFGGWACSDQDYHLVEFNAINMAGNQEDGFVCCGKMDPLYGYSKGCTIRN